VKHIVNYNYFKDIFLKLFSIMSIQIESATNETDSTQHEGGSNEYIDYTENNHSMIENDPDGDFNSVQAKKTIKDLRVKKFS